ncbi:hypothetical protein ON010_g18895 [Phytophthora cinnamomi]|nr:hypothetical protein ON010_g18895 [Phytophthora cinnamomi]
MSSYGGGAWAPELCRTSRTLELRYQRPGSHALRVSAVPDNAQARFHMISHGDREIPTVVGNNLASAPDRRICVLRLACAATGAAQSARESRASTTIVEWLTPATSRATTTNPPPSTQASSTMHYSSAAKFMERSAMSQLYRRQTMGLLKRQRFDSIMAPGTSFRFASTIAPAAQVGQTTAVEKASRPEPTNATNEPAYKAHFTQSRVATSENGEPIWENPINHAVYDLDKITNMEQTHHPIALTSSPATAAPAAP